MSDIQKIPRRVYKTRPDIINPSLVDLDKVIFQEYLNQIAADDWEGMAQVVLTSVSNIHTLTSAKKVLLQYIPFLFADVAQKLQKETKMKLDQHLTVIINQYPELKPLLEDIICAG